MVSGPKPLARIRRMRQTIGADCMGCGWQDFTGNRQSAIKHARAEGHVVHFVLEETTVYSGRTTEGTPS